MDLTVEEREQVASELKRFSGELHLTDDQKEKLRAALTEAQQKMREYLKQNPNTAVADVIKKVAASRDALRQRIATFLSVEQLSKWDNKVAKAKEFLGQKIAA